MQHMCVCVCEHVPTGTLIRRLERGSHLQQQTVRGVLVQGGEPRNGVMAFWFWCGVSDWRRFCQVRALSFSRRAEPVVG